MKKILVALMAICMVITLCVTLTSCAHKCEFSTDWSKDATHHWHACIGEECVEVADKAEHVWDNACDTSCNTCGQTRTTEHNWNAGEITTKPTQAKDGVKTFTCTICSETKTETVPFTGLTVDEWNDAFSSSSIENFTYNEASSTKGSGMTMDTEVTYKFTEDKAYVKMLMAGQTQEETINDKLTANALRKQMVDSIRELAVFADYSYDAATKTYKAVRDIKIDSLDASTSDITLKFNDDNKLVELKYTVEFEMSGIDFTATSTVTLSDYGTTKI